MHLNDQLNECARSLKDGKLGGGNTIAKEFQFQVHVACLTDLYNRERTHLRTIKR